MIYILRRRFSTTIAAVKVLEKGLIGRLISVGLSLMTMLFLDLV
jgi:hypothetical protein